MKNSNLVVVALVLLAIAVGEGYYIMKGSATKGIPYVTQTQAMQAKKPTPRSARPTFVMKGQKFADNPISKKAYLIAPVTGPLSRDAQIALTGWTVKTTNNPDGSLQVNLIPQETEDVQQQFTVKPGNKLYFIELTLADDSATGGDANRGDDIGVLVDQNGIVL